MSFISPFFNKKYPKFIKLKGLNFYTFHVGFKKKNTDLLIAVFDKTATSSGVTTKSTLPAAPVLWIRKIIKYGKCKVLLVNSGIANAFTGEAGKKAVNENVKLASKIFKCKAQEVYISSTGLIGELLDYNKINKAIMDIKKTKKTSIYEASKSIMTTDTFPKVAKKNFKYKNKIFKIVGFAKGSGMIAPNMATMLAYLFIDIPVSKKILDKIILDSVDSTFNSILVDNTTSTNDTVLLFALENFKIKKLRKYNDPRYKILTKNLKLVMKNLAQQIVMDGEGISKFMTTNFRH